MKHELKIKPEYFAAVVTGEKTFEIRNNSDRNFQVGDTLVLKSWDGEFNGNFVERTVSYITDFEQKPGYVVLGLANKREQELAEQLADATRQCGVMAELLRDVTKIVPAIGVAIDDLPVVDAFLERIEAALAGKLPEQHSDDTAVDLFAVAMKTKLASARAKGRSGWDDPAACSVEHLADLLLEHIGKGNSGTFEDIANFAMMLHQRGADPALLVGQWPAHAVPDALVSLSDIASLQRYTLGGSCDSFDQDCGAEMEQDDEGEYIMLEEALALSPSKQGD